MGTFISTYGELHIPDEKWDAFIEDAKKVALQGGLFSECYVSGFGKYFTLLTFPSFDKNDNYADFTRNAYSYESWESAGINLKKHSVYSDKVGSGNFNRAVHALYILAEIYSDKPFVSVNDYVNRPIDTIKWLRYVLNRNVQYTWRKDMWIVYELVMRKELNWDSDYSISSEHFVDGFLGDRNNMSSLMSAVLVNSNLKEMCDSMSETAEKDKLSYLNIINLFRKEVTRIKSEVASTETQQISYLLKLLLLTPEEIKSDSSKDLSDGLKISLVFLPAPICVKIISEEYDKNFWILWDNIKDRACMKKVSMFSENEESPENTDTLSTKDFFNLNSDDDLLWWISDSADALSEELQSWAKEKSERLQELNNTATEDNISEWQRRFVNCLSSRPAILCFEHMFYEFIGNFHSPVDRAAVKLLEETEDDQEYARLLRIFANEKLRKNLFGF